LISVRKQRAGGLRPRAPVSPPVSVRTGRWGCRRLRVTECRHVLRAEDAYRDLLQFCPKPHCQTLEATTAVGNVTVELRANAVWPHGRLFYRCSRCAKLATRLYVPASGLDLRCRRCWGLAYASQQWNYRGGWFERSKLYGWTLDARAERRQQARARRRRRAI
jgi:hypothetical protein